MMKTPVRVLVGAVVAIGMLGLASNPAGLTGASAPAALPKLSPLVPSDLPLTANDDSAAEFAWRSFVAVNWPARAGSRGVPNANKVIGQPGDLVWNTWKSPDEIFYADGRRPPAWNGNSGALPPQCRTAGASAGAYWLRRTSKVPGDVDNQALRDAKQVVGGTLTDQHGNLVRYEVRLNKAIFDNILAKQYYNIEGQNKASSISFPAAVMEVKASWRELTAADSPVKSRFVRRVAWIYTPAGQSAPASCIQSEVGLVGLHVTQKTPSRPQWTWATFEHVDNVPPFNAPVPPGRTLPYSFNKPGCPVTQCVPDSTTENHGVPTRIPTQVTRLVNIGAAAQRANPQWQSALAAAVPGSPFQYYQLVDIQWPLNPGQRPAGNPTPGLSANTTMETYIGRSSSCISCHYTAQRASGTISSDYSFMLAEAHSIKVAK